MLTLPGERRGGGKKSSFLNQRPLIMKNVPLLSITERKKETSPLVMSTSFQFSSSPKLAPSWNGARLFPRRREGELSLLKIKEHFPLSWNDLLCKMHDSRGIRRDFEENYSASNSTVSPSPQSSYPRGHYLSAASIGLDWARLRVAPGVVRGSRPFPSSYIEP